MVKNEEAGTKEQTVKKYTVGWCLFMQSIRITFNQ